MGPLIVASITSWRRQIILSGGVDRGTILDTISTFLAQIDFGHYGSRKQHQVSGCGVRDILLTPSALRCPPHHGANIMLVEFTV